MSYLVTADGAALCSFQAEEMAISNAVVSLEANKAGTFKFTMMPDHPFYNALVFRQTMIDVYQNGEIIFEGVPVKEKIAFNNAKTVECEGELTFLNDTIQRQAVYTNQSISDLLDAYLTVHNAQADSNRTFTTGIVSVTGPTILSRITDYTSTMTALTSDLLNEFGGYWHVWHHNGVRYLDYLESSPRTSKQVVEIGKNLMDLVQDTASQDICTVLIPLGAKTGNSIIDGLEERLTVKTVNSGNDYIIATSVSTFGHIWKTKVFEDIDSASDLLAAGNAYLTDGQWANLSITATAVDLGLTIEEVDQFRILDNVRVVSAPHGLDRYFMLTKLQIDLNKPGNTRVTLGTSSTPTIAKKTAKTAQTVTKQNTDLQVSAAGTARDIAAEEVSGLDSSLNAEDVFNRLTDNGTIQGIFRDSVTGDLYINGEWIQASTIRADSIQTTAGTDWLDVINEFLGYGTSSGTFVKLGGWKAYAQEVSGTPSMNYITFAPSTIGGIFFTVYPAGTTVTTINSQTATSVLTITGSSESWALTKEYGFVQIQ